VQEPNRALTRDYLMEIMHHREQARSTGHRRAGGRLRRKIEHDPGDRNHQVGARALATCSLRGSRQHERGAKARASQAPDAATAPIDAAARLYSRSSILPPMR
jgi:hypothetical protein